ncbi:MAG: ABC-F family ATP-binding cassette domain-containing protein [Clostridia bacterium]|jgi:ATP-binding cassette subfamily F protein 3|nr:ABC-F family ATP-binding cassette domain-containing protein [Clostridia bacterium]
MSLLNLENIVKEYRNQTVLNGVSLRVEKGERLALIGPNGAGKSTLLKIALGLETPDSGNVVSAKNSKIGYLSQDLQDVESSEDKDTEIALHYEEVYRLEKKLRALEAQMAEPGRDASSEAYRELMKAYSRLLLRYEAMDGYTIETKIGRILMGLGLRRENLNTPLARLSGGEKMRVTIARILLEEPDLLILDEPTNHLDIKATEWLESFLKKFTGGILFVSHDRYFLDKVATRIAELENGSLIIRSGSYSNFMEQKKLQAQFGHSEQKRLQLALKTNKAILQTLKSHRNISAVRSREKQAQRLEEELKAGRGQKSGAHFPRKTGPKIAFKKIKHLSKDIAWAENLTKRFGPVTLLQGAGFHIRGGDRVGIIGPNGAGKTTLLKMMLGQDTDYTGIIKIGGWVKYSWMGQEIIFENEHLTMLQLLLSYKEISEREARDYLSRFEFYGDAADKKVEVLSGGEKVRLYLACMMLDEADCLILDEPTNHLDVPARNAFEAALQSFQGTIIAVTHDRFYLTHCVDRILEVDNGIITTYEGNYDFYKQIKYGPAEEDNEECIEEKPKAENSKRAQRVERAKDNAAGRKADQERLALEARIISLEERLKELESAFDPATPVETYREYDELLQEAERLYSQWDALTD